MNKTKLIVIKSKENSGKTTTIWLVYLELLNRGAKVKHFSNTFDGAPRAIPTSLPEPRDRYDFVAEIEWNGMRIVIISQGDVYSHVDGELQKILPTEPDFVICASRSQWRDNSTWDLFVAKYTNLNYERVCFWSEKAVDQKDEELVKRPTIEAIIKYMKP